MSDNQPVHYQDERMVRTGVRQLTPETTQIFEGTFSLLHCAIREEGLYRGVYAVLLFPIRYPDRYISLRYTDVEDKDREIGVIERIDTFSEEAQRLIRNSLVKQYYEQRISRIYRVEYKHGVLFFDVELPAGRREFMMWWSGMSTEEFGVNGKVLLDVHENRYIIPDVTRLPANDRREFTAFIYW